MNFTMTRTVSESFTLTHAKYLASKVVADMKRCQQSYNQPTDSAINDFGTELALLLRDGYVSQYEFGFKVREQRLVSWQYTAAGSSLDATDDRPGRIVSGVNITGASFFNYLTFSTSWSSLAYNEQLKIEASLPFRRTAGEPPKDGLGYWAQDCSYSSTGFSLTRKTFRPFGS